MSPDGCKGDFEGLREGVFEEGLLLLYETEEGLVGVKIWNR